MNDIDILTQRYLDGDTSLQEERRLAELIAGCPNPTEEQKAIAAMLCQGVMHGEEEMDQWLAEDETALYDSIVSQRQRRKGIMKWAAAASVAAIVGLALWLNLPRTDSGTAPVAVQRMPVVDTDTAMLPRHEPAATTPMTAGAARQAERQPPKNTAAAARQERKTEMTEDFHAALAYIEARLDAVVDSVSQAQAEQIIVSDAQLSRLAYSTE